MANRIDECFEALRREGRAAFIAYQTCGDPDLARSFEISAALADAGVDILELGIPFSDPLADGPTIQAASQRAIQAGSNVPALLEHLADFRRKCQIPIVLFTYLNPIYSYGCERFQKDALAAGADGLLILDLPPDEADFHPEIRPLDGLHPIRLVAPNTPEERFPAILSKSGGFVYYVSREGVTGEQSTLSSSMAGRVDLLHKYTRLPIAVGFGISTPEQAAEVASLAEGVVVGSAIVRRIAEHPDGNGLAHSIGEFVRPMVEATHAVRQSA